MKASKRWSLLLALVLVFSFTSAAFASIGQEQKNQLHIYNHNDYKKDALEDLEEQIGDSLKDRENEIFSFIVEVDDQSPFILEATGGIKPNFPSSLKDKIGINRQIAYARQTQNLVRKEIDKSGLRIKKSERDYSFQLVANGFTVQATYEQARKIAQLAGVKSVSFDTEISLPRNEIQTIGSNDMIHATRAWANGYKGTGRVIAVLDSGIDVNHKDLILTDEPAAKWSRESIEDYIQGEEMLGYYYTPKVPYGYNYFDGNRNLLDTNPDTGMHGMHVAGIVGSNGDIENGGIKGVAPEVQLLAMRVFGQEIPTTYASIYVKAIDDAIKLGADGINMSLGSPGGIVDSLPKIMGEAIDKAKRAGSIIIVAAGNDGYFSSLWDLPYASNPDYGIVGAPAVAQGVLSVASVDNALMRSDLIKVNDESLPILMAGGSKVNPGMLGKEYPIVNCGYGLDEDYDDKDLSNKVALIKRGQDTFSNLVVRAQEKNAIAVLIYNNDRENPELLVNMEVEGAYIPSGSISYNSGEKILQIEEEWLLEFSNEKIMIPNPNGYKMSDFSSWGTSPNLSFKPEITAPGGGIYSLLNNNKYGSMSGTSMATPFIGGATALVNQRVEDLNIPNLTMLEKQDLSKNILLSTARPLITEEGKESYYSPRKQGAGLVDLDLATSDKLAIVVDNNPTNETYNRSLIELKEISSYDISLNSKIKNLSDEDLKYQVKYIVQTDKAIDGQITLDPLVLKANTLGDIEISANSSYDLNVDFNFEEEALSEDLEAKFPNGYFLDGFILLEPIANSTGQLPISLSIPFFGFKGDWERDPEIIESFINDFDLEEGEKPFYMTKENGNQDYSSFPNNNFTHFYTDIIDENGMNSTRIMGHDYGDNFQGNLAISPNKDGSGDTIKFRGVFLRAFSDLSFEILDQEGNLLHRINDARYKHGRKNYYVLPGNEKSFYTEVWGWDGNMGSSNSPVQDGEYLIRINARIRDKEDAAFQTKTKKIYVDTRAPEILSLEKEYREGKLHLEINAQDELSGIRRYFLEYQGQVFENIASMEDSNKFVIDLDEDFEPVKDEDQIRIRIQDWAYNEFDASLDLIDNQSAASIEVEVRKANEGTLLPQTNFVAIDEEGKEYTNLKQLPFGNYQVIDKNESPEYKIVRDPVDGKLVLDEENRVARIIFTYEELDSNNFAQLNIHPSINENYQAFNSQMMFGITEVLSMDEDGVFEYGKTHRIHRSLSEEGNAYSIRLAEGLYELRVLDLPEDWQASNDRKLIKLESQKEYDQSVVYSYGEKSFELLIVTNFTDGIIMEDIIDGVNIVNRDTGEQIVKNNEVVKEGVHMANSLTDFVLGFLPFKCIKVSNLEEATYLIDFSPDLLASKDLQSSPSVGAADLIGTNRSYTFNFSRSSKVQGSINVNTVFLNPQYQNLGIDIEYEISNVLGRPVDPNHLSYGSYYIRPINYPEEFIPENEYKEIILTRDNLHVDVDYRWINVEDQKDKNGQIQITAVYDPHKYVEDFQVRFTDRLTGEDYSFTIDNEKAIGNAWLPYGLYKISIENIQNGFYVEEEELNHLVSTGEGFLEIHYKEGSKYIEPKEDIENPAHIIINELGIDKEDYFREYSIVDAEGREYVLRQEENLLISEDLPAGIYTIRNIRRPYGKVVLNKSIELLLEENQEKTIDFEFIKVGKLNIVSQVVDRSGNPLDREDYPYYFNSDYQAIYQADTGQEVEFNIQAIPQGMDIKISSSNLSYGYDLLSPETGEYLVNLGKEEETILFTYVVDPSKLNYNNLELAMEDALALLNEERDGEELDPDYRIDVEEVLEEASHLITSPSFNQTSLDLMADKILRILSKPIWNEIVDKSQLKELIDRAETIDLEDLNEESAQALRLALEEAILVWEDEDSSQDEVDMATDNLDYVLDNLVFISPLITNIQPNEDQTLVAGDQLRVSFQGPENGTAYFRLRLSMGMSSINMGIPMEEFQAGYYTGEWTIPDHTLVEDLIIDLIFIHEDGTSIYKEAKGRINIVEEVLEIKNMEDLDSNTIIVGNEAFHAKYLNENKEALRKLNNWLANPENHVYVLLSNVLVNGDGQVVDMNVLPDKLTYYDELGRKTIYKK